MNMARAKKTDGGLVVIIVGAVAAAIAGAVYWWRGRKPTVLTPSGPPRASLLGTRVEVEDEDTADQLAAEQVADPELH